MSAASHYTPTERRILRLLADGLPHRSRELLTCLFDDLSGLPAVRAALCKLRKKLRPLNQDILIEFVNYSVHYRHVDLRIPVTNGDGR